MHNNKLANNVLALLSLAVVVEVSLEDGTSVVEVDDPAAIPVVNEAPLAVVTLAVVATPTYQRIMGEKYHLHSWKLQLHF